MAFSIMVQGFKSRRALTAVRGAQVAAVNMMMRYVQERDGVRVDAPATFDEPAASTTRPRRDRTEDEVARHRPRSLPRGWRSRRTSRARRGHAQAGARPRGGHQEGPAAAPPATKPEDPRRNRRNARADLRSGAHPSGPPACRWGGGVVGSRGGDAVPGAPLRRLGRRCWASRRALYGTTFHALQGPGAGRSEWTRIVGAVGPRYH